MCCPVKEDFQQRVGDSSTHNNTKGNCMDTDSIETILLGINASNTFGNTSFSHLLLRKQNFL